MTMMGRKQKNRQPKSKEYVESSDDSSDIDAVVKYIEGEIDMPGSPGQLKSPPKKKKCKSQRKTQRRTRSKADAAKEAQCAAKDTANNDITDTPAANNTTLKETGASNDASTGISLDDILDIAVPDNNVEESDVVDAAPKCTTDVKPMDTADVQAPSGCPPPSNPQPNIAMPHPSPRRDPHPHQIRVPRLNLGTKN